MPGPVPPMGLTDLHRAVAASRVDVAVDAAVHALKAGTPAAEVVHAAAVGAASCYNTPGGNAPHGLLALASAAGASASMDEASRRLATLQAVLFAASVTKLPSPPPPPAVVKGEVTHLARSVLFAVRAGDLSQAESLFLGIVEEGWERRMAGDVLFQAALEDRGDSGHKLLAAVQSWELAAASGFRDARTILRPAVQYLVKGPRDLRPHALTMAVLGRGRVDLDALAASSARLDDAGRGTLATALAAPADESCVTAILALLREGYSLAAVAQGIVTEAARRALATEGYGLDSLHALLYAHAARRVVAFTRASERVHAVFQAALRVRSPAPHLLSVSVADARGEDEGLRRVADDLEARRPREAAARVRAYLAEGLPAGRLLGVLGSHACRDSSLANQGHNLAILDACAQEYHASGAPEVLMACAKLIAASPRDPAAAKAWTEKLAR